MSRLYSDFKFSRHPEQIEAWRNHTVVAPVHVRIKPMNHCNHNCWYCAYRYDALQLGEDIDLKDQIPAGKMDEIVDDVIDMGVKAVTFSGGGEPTLYKPLPDCVEKLAGAGVRVATLTNGSNLKGRIAEVFAAHGTWVRVSMDAWDGESYAKARGIKEDAFDNMMTNMRNFIALKSDCVLGVSFIIGHDNHGHVYDICSQLKDVGVNHVKLSGVVVANDVDGNNTYHDEIRGTVESEIEKALALGGNGFDVVNHYHALTERFEKDYTICPFLQYLTVIGADCNVYTCQDKAYTDSGMLGSIKDRRFKDFWFSDETREALYAFDPSVSCSHHCVAHGKNLAILEHLDGGGNPAVPEHLNLDEDHGAFV